MDCFQKIQVSLGLFYSQIQRFTYWVIVHDTMIEDEIVAWKPRCDIHILTLDEVDDSTEYFHARIPRRNVWGEWAKADIIAN